MAFSGYRKPISMVRWVISISLLIPILTIWSFFLTGHWQSYKVISRSMEPTLLVDDYLIMRQQNDFPNLDNLVVVVQDPSGGSFPLVKRVLAGANSTVRVSNARIYLDGSKTPLSGEPLVDTPNRTWRLSPDQVYVLGDNRNNSQDSTDFGPISRRDILGVITYRYWPIDRIGKVE